jgi:hypothetical protein
MVGVIDKQATLMNKTQQMLVHACSPSVTSAPDKSMIEQADDIMSSGIGATSGQQVNYPLHQIGGEFI